MRCITLTYKRYFGEGLKYKFSRAHECTLWPADQRLPAFSTCACRRVSWSPILAIKVRSCCAFELVVWFNSFCFMLSIFFLFFFIILLWSLFVSFQNLDFCRYEMWVEYFLMFFQEWPLNTRLSARITFLQIRAFVSSLIVSWQVRVYFSYRCQLISSSVQKYR